MTAIASQGLEIMGDDGYWVTQYSLNYSCDGVRWFPHWHEGTSMVSYVKLFTFPMTGYFVYHRVHF